MKDRPRSSTILGIAVLLRHQSRIRKIVFPRFFALSHVTLHTHFIDATMLLTKEEQDHAGKLHPQIVEVCQTHNISI